MGTGGWSTACRLGVVLVVLVALRTLPFVIETHRTAPVDPVSGRAIAFTDCGFIPKDFAQYLAFTEQTRRHGTFVYENPYTTEPQRPRYVLAFFWATGTLARLVGLSTPVAYEAMRFLMAPLLGWALWVWLAVTRLPTRDRAYAWCLVMTAAGLEWIGWAMPDPIPLWTGRIYWEMYGWNTFETLFNPMWMFCLACVLLSQDAVRRWLEGGAGPGALGVVVAAHAALLATHSYSFLPALAAVGFTLVLAAVDEPAAVQSPRVRALAAVAVALAGAAVLLGRWQAEDTVFHTTAMFALLKTQSLPFVFWPIGFGVAFWFAVQGARSRGWFGRHPIRGDAAWRGWVAAELVLGVLPWLSAYKFLYLAHAPVVALAAVEVLRRRDAERRPLLPAAVLAVSMIGTAFVVARSVREPTKHLGSFYMYDADKRVLRALADAPPGGILTEPFLGQFAPWLADRKVYAGHWFLTPDYDGRIARIRRFFASADGDLEWKRAFLGEAAVRYVVYGTESAKPTPEAAAALELHAVGASDDRAAIAYRVGS